MVAFSKPKHWSDQDRIFVVKVGPFTARVVMDGHGGHVGLGAYVSPLFFSIFMDPLVQAAKGRLEELLSLEWAQTHSNLKEVAEEVKVGLLHTIVETMVQIARRRADADPLFAKAHCGTTCTIVLSRGGEHVAIWIGDSPVYSLKTGKLLTPANGCPKNPEEHIPKGWALMDFRAYPNSRCAMFTGMSKVHHSAVGLEMPPPKKGTTAKQLPNVLRAIWSIYPWKVSEPFTGPYLLASDGIDHLLPKEELTDADRLPLLLEIATNPWKVVADKYGERSPSDDITIVAFGVEQVSVPHSLPVPVQEEQAQEEFMLIPASP
jgi:serine/threonine protein phosphatase PrpC